MLERILAFGLFARQAKISENLSNEPPCVELLSADVRIQEIGSLLACALAAVANSPAASSCWAGPTSGGAGPQPWRMTGRARSMQPAQHPAAPSRCFSGYRIGGRKAFINRRHPAVSCAVEKRNGTIHTALQIYDPRCFASFSRPDVHSVPCEPLSSESGWPYVVDWLQSTPVNSFIVGLVLWGLSEKMPMHACKGSTCGHVVSSPPPAPRSPARIRATLALARR